MKPNVLMLSALLCAGASSPASAQHVYKCWSMGAVVYSQVPCSKHIVNTNEAPVPLNINRRERRECTRLDTRILAEVESTNSPDRAVAMKAEAALEKSKKRFTRLRC